MLLRLKGDNMNTKLELFGWKFSFDKNITQNYYENYSDLCKCESCQNFYKNINAVSDVIRNFIEQFGIDINKPIELESIIADKSKDIVEYTVYYAVNGNATSLISNDILFGESIVQIIPDEISPNTYISKPYFVFAISNLWLPWTTDYNINDIYD